MDGLLFRSRAAVLWVALTVALMGSWLLILLIAGLGVVGSRQPSSPDVTDAIAATR